VAILIHEPQIRTWTQTKHQLLVASTCVALAALGAATIAGLPPTTVLAVLAVSTYAIVLSLTRHRLAPAVFSPVTVVTGGLVVIGALGSVAFASFRAAKFGSSARITLTQDQTWDTLVLILLSAASIFAGAVTVLYALPKPQQQPGPLVPALSGALAPWLFIASLFPLGAQVVLAGSSLLSRELYIDAVVSSSPILNLTNQLAIAAIIVLGYLFIGTSPTMRISVIIALVAYFALFASGGSRTMAMMIPLAALGAFAAKQSKRTGTALFVAAILCLYLVQLSLYFRTLQRHGLIPYLQSLSDFPQSGIGLSDVALNLLFSFGIIGVTAYQSAPLTPSTFWISVDPSPGDTAGWYQVASSLRLNINTPFAGIGELGNHGVAYLIPYCLVVGIVLAVFERQTLAFRRLGYGSLSLVPLGLSALFLLYAVQYNLRSSTRLLVYGLVLALVLQIVVGSRRRHSPHARIHTLGRI
jgi:hypothetical protein